MADFAGFQKGTAKFLRGLTKNNNKAWFDENRAAYQADYVAPALAFISAMGPRLRKISPQVAFEPKVNGSLFRVNRDVRFSKDKTPYKNHIDLWFWHGDRRSWNAPGFFFRMYADRLILGAGMHKFDKPQLSAFRHAVVEERSGKALVKACDTVKAAGPYEIGGASRKTVPRGFDANGPRAKFLLHEGLSPSLDTKAGKIVETPEFLDFCFAHFKAMWPVSRWLMKEVVEKAEA